MGQSYIQQDAKKRGKGAILWLEKSVEVLKEEGIESVRIEHLAQKLGLTKGSFYHHYGTRQDLLDEILDYYYQVYFERYVELVSTKNVSPKERLWLVMQKAVKESSNVIDFAMRAWAKQDTKVADFVFEIEKKRVEIVHSLFQEIGFSQEESHVRARMLIHANAGELYTGIDLLPLKKRLRMARIAHSIITSKNEK